MKCKRPRRHAPPQHPLPIGHVCAGRRDLSATGSDACSGSDARVCVFLRSGFEHLRLCSIFCLLRPSAPALRCLGAISGAGGLPRLLDFSCVCVKRVPVAPAVVAVLPYLCLVPWWPSVWCDACVVSWYNLIGPIGIVLSARHKHSTPAGTSTKHTHSLKHRHIHALHKALPSATGKQPHKLLEEPGVATR